MVAGVLSLGIGFDPVEGRRHVGSLFFCVREGVVFQLGSYEVVFEDVFASERNQHPIERADVFGRSIGC